MKFASHPFVIITTLFVLGVLAAFSLPIQGVFLFSFFVIVLFSALIMEMNGFNRKIVTGLLLLSVFLFGASVANIGQDKISNNFSTADFYLAEVEEIDPPGKEWRKAICSVFGRVSNSEIEPLDEKVLLILKGNLVERNDRVLAQLTLQPISNNNNPGEFDAVNYWRSKNIYNSGFLHEAQYKIIGHRPLGFVSESIYSLKEIISNVLEEGLSGDNLNIARALILGDKNSLDSDVKESFSNAGAMHVLAVSGLHVGILLYLLMFLFERFPSFITKNTAMIIAVVIIWVYAGVTGFSPSVIRASFMFSLLVIGQRGSYQLNSLNLLFFSAFVLLVLNPMLLFDIGFQLSYLAMIGILIFHPIISTLFYIKNKWLLKIWEGTSVGISAQLLTIPLTLYYFHQFPNYFAFTNIGIMLLAGLILGLGLLLIAVNWWGYGVQFVGIVLGFFLFVLLFFVQFIEGLPGAVASGFSLTVAAVVGLYGLIFCYLLFRRKKQLVIPIVAVTIGSLIWIQFVRYQHIVKREVVLFNSNKLAVAIKYHNTLIALHNLPEATPKHLEYLIKGYEQLYPANIQFRKLEYGVTEFVFNQDTIKLMYSEDGLGITENGKKTFLKMKYNALIPAEHTTIAAPYLSSSENELNLKNGAHRIAID